MTRKRFIKLLMGNYYMGRNLATEMAETCRQKCQPYKLALHEYEQIIQKMAEALNIPADVLKHPQNGESKAWRIFRKTLRGGANQ